MQIKRSDGGMLEIDGKVRIESGPARRRETATVELLSDKLTAAHYAVGKPDALGKIIELGKPFDFIDFRSDKRVFTVYLLTEVEDEVAGAKIKNMRFLPQGVHDTEDAALSQATDLAVAPKKGKV